MKKRMRVVTKEKRDYEDKYLQVSLSLEKKTKELSVCREQRAELEAGVTQLESLSQQQLQRLATHSEAAVDAAQAQVTAAHTILTRYQQFVKVRGEYSKFHCVFISKFNLCWLFAGSEGLLKVHDLNI